MKTTITVLCENSVLNPLPFIGEHGFSVLIENGETTLFDTGQGLGLLHNMSVLGKKSENIQRIIISHGHYDHTGGLLPLLKSRNINTPVYIHPEAFREKRAMLPIPGSDQSVPIGMKATRQEYELAGASFHEIRGYNRVSQNIFSLSDVRRPEGWKTWDTRLVARHCDELKSDPFNDDMSLMIETDSGPVVILGCAHAGIVEILEQLSEESGHREFHAIIGGTHLESAPADYVQKAMETIRRFKVKTVAVSHCTGFRIACQFAREVPDSFANASVGKVFNF